MKQEALFHGVYATAPDPNNPLRITRRMGDKPSHMNCDCPSSWTLVIKPHSQGQDTFFAVDVELQDLNPTERDEVTSQVKRIDGSGGLAPYENLGIVSRRGDLLRSLAVVSMQTGVLVLPDGALQEPLFTLSDPMPELRWDSEFPIC
jgi:hypothetical protein